MRLSNKRIFKDKIEIIKISSLNNKNIIYNDTLPYWKNHKTEPKHTSSKLWLHMFQKSTLSKSQENEHWKGDTNALKFPQADPGKD